MHNRNKPSTPTEIRNRQHRVLETWRSKQDLKVQQTTKKIPYAKPKHSYQLIGLAIASFMICSGIWMLHSGIKADGSLDIKSAFVSGSIEADSAGLILVFLGFVIVMASIYAPSSSTKSVNTEKPSKQAEKSNKQELSFNLTSHNQKIVLGLVLVGLLSAVMIVTGQFAIFSGILAVVSGTLIRKIVN